ncbi:NAD(P)-dependent oxidoreductase [Methylobacterium sp. BTF04]|uniref:NAD-dependent epimerase/dehydratase family protein n=1 Tax=Methylobacterium sp. BTF04 TaxID=2708300 RepID=UPI0013D6D5FD|nr:NAD(P)-dependent oxidoreductase [Methylobacterium sp. BTF04]NEU12962.1 NAD(P)-dependent oxidoreductase [Methylobacterium sp. BTF04]
MDATLDGIALSDLDDAIGRVEAALRGLDGATLFVTGGTGFFGRWLVALMARARQRLDLDLSIAVLSRDPAAFAVRYPGLASEVRLVAGDVRDFPSPEGRFTHLIHAATDTVSPDDAVLDQVGSIIDGTRRVLAFAARAGVRRLLYVSSGAIYGRQPPDLPTIPETYAGACDPLDPRSAYGQAKRLAEQLCAIANARGDTEAVVARAFAFVGPGLPLDAHFAIGNFIRDALGGGTIVVAGDGRPLRSYLYAGDLAAWLVTLLVRGNAGEAYNVGSDHAVDIAALARRVGALIPAANGVEIRGQAVGDPARERYVPSIAKARGQLGLDVWTPLDAAIVKTAAFTTRTRKPA